MFNILHLVEYVGNFHMHTPYSDGFGGHAEIARAALQAHIDFVVVTDHNVLVQGVDGYFGDEQSGYVLLLTGEEIHDQGRLPQVNHLLVFDTNVELAQHAHHPQKLIDAVNAAGGLCFLAHPNDGAIAWLEEPAIPWEDWDVQGFAGLEIWNYMSSAKELMPTPTATLRAGFRPEDAMTGPNTETLAIWDRLLAQGQRIIGIGNADAHGTVYHVGPISHEVYPYDFLFNCVNTHLLLTQPLTGQFDRDKASIFRALRAGHAFVAYDLVGDARGFRFSAHGHSTATIMGGVIRLGSGVTLQAIAPARSHFKVIHHGKIVMEARDRENITYTAQQPGAYRIEVWREFRGKERAWILSNPIYVEDANYRISTL